jgi:hypothetical protein
LAWEKVRGYELQVFYFPLTLAIVPLNRQVLEREYDNFTTLAFFKYYEIKRNDFDV